MRPKIFLCGFLAGCLAGAVAGATTFDSQTLDNVTDETETAVSVSAGATLSLRGTNAFSAATLTLGAGAKLACAEGATNVVLRVKTFAVGANCVVDAGVTLIGDFVSETVKGKTFTVNGVVKSSGQIYSNQGLSVFNGTGTIWADNLAVRNPNQAGMDASSAGQLTFYNKRVNLRGNSGSIIGRQWGNYRFQNEIFGFWGKDTAWQRAGEGTANTRIIGQNGRIVFDTLDAEDGVTPRTFTWTDTCVKPAVNPVLVVKTNPGTMIVNFNLSSYLTNGTTVEGGTLRFPIAAPTFSGPVTVVNEGSLLDLPSATGAVPFNGALTIVDGAVNLPSATTVSVAGACSVTNANFTLPAATSAVFSGAVSVSGGDFTLPQATNVVCSGAVSLDHGQFAAPRAAAVVNGALTLGSNAVVAVSAGYPLTVAGGAKVTGPATVVFDLPANAQPGVYPVIKGFGTSTDGVTLTLNYAGTDAATMKSDGANIVVVLTSPPLTWKGGDGKWSDTNWLTPEGETVAWSDGAAACLPAGSGTIALAGDVQVQTLDVKGDWTLSGTGCTVTDDLGLVTVEANARLVWGATLASSGSFVKSGAGRFDLTAAGELPSTVEISGGTLGLPGETDWSTKHVLIGFGATLGAVSDAVQVTIGDFQPSSGAVIGAGVTVTPLGTLTPSRLAGLVVNGTLILTTPNNTTYNTVELAGGLSGVGTVQVPALGLSGGATSAMRNLTFVFTGSEDRFVGRMWGTYDFYDATFRFTGGDLAAVAGDTRDNAVKFHGLCTFDTLDAADGATPRTVTFDYQPSTSVYIQVGAGDGGVRKINPGVLVFGVPALYTGATRVEGGTFIHRAALASSSVFVTGSDTVFSNQCSASTSYTAPVTLAAGARFGAAYQPRFAALTVGANACLAFPLTSRLDLGATEFAFLDDTATLTFELEIPSVLAKGAYPLLEGPAIRAADASRFVLTVPKGLPSGLEGRLLVRDGAVYYLVTESTLSATTATWFGDGETRSWSEGANWDLAAAPSAGLDLFLTGEKNVTNTFDLAGQGFRNLTFGPLAGPFEVQGAESLDLSGTLVNASAARETLDVPVAFSAATAVLQQADGTAGQLAFAKSLTASALQMKGPVQASFDGAVRVSGIVNASGSSTVVDGSGSLVASGNLAVAAGASLAWGVDSASFAGGLQLNGKYVRLTFTGGTTSFGAAQTAYLTSANMNSTITVADGAHVYMTNLSSSQVYNLVVDGVITFSNWLSISPAATYTWIAGAGTVEAEGLEIKNGSSLAIAVPQLRLGTLGLNVSNYIGTCSARFGQVATTIAPTGSDFVLGSDGRAVFEGYRSTDTETVLRMVDTNGVPRTVSFGMELAGAGDFAVAGQGSFVLAPWKTTFTGTMRTTDGAAVKLGASIASCGELQIENGTKVQVAADELVLPKKTSVQAGGVFATSYPVTLSNAVFAAGAVVKPVRATYQDAAPVIALGGVTEFPSDGALALDLSEALVGDSWTLIFDWAAAGKPASFALDRVAVKDKGLYRFKVAGEGLYVARSGIWILLR